MPLRRGLERQSTDWVDAGIVSADQRRGMIDFEANITGRARRQRLVTILAILGAALVSLGMALVVSQNWNEGGRPPKLSAGIALLLACYGGGYWVRHGRLKLVRTGEGILLLGTGAFLGNLALISQQYHIAFNPAPVVFPVLWSAVAFALLFASRAYAFVAAVLLVVWLILESQRAGSPLEAEAGAIMLLLPGAGAWLIAGAALQRGSARAQLSAPIELVGGILFAAAVYLLGFYRHLGIEGGLPPIPSVVFLMAPMGVVTAMLLATAGQAEARLGWLPIHDSLRPPLLLGQLTLLLVLGWTLIAALVPPPAGADPEGLLITVVYWAGACLLAGSLAWLGLALGRESWLNAALVFLGLFIVTRYFDLVSDYARTGGLFVGAGLLCLALAFLIELGRRRLSRGMDRPAGGAAVGG